MADDLMTLRKARFWLAVVYVYRCDFSTDLEFDDVLLLV
jgi:hypothetical protein